METRRDSCIPESRVRTRSEVMSHAKEKKERKVAAAIRAKIENDVQAIYSLMMEATQLGLPLSKYEQYLLEFGIKEMIKEKRVALKFVREVNNEQNKRARLSRKKRREVEDQLEKFCLETIDKLESCLTSGAKDPESKVFMFRVIGDCHRYLHDLDESELTESKIEAAYGEALKISELKLAPTNSTKLILIVNFSMFYKQIMNCIKKSYEIIEHALSMIDCDIGTLDNQSYELVQLLKKNEAMLKKQMRAAVPNKGDLKREELPFFMSAEKQLAFRNQQNEDQEIAAIPQIN